MISVQFIDKRPIYTEMDCSSHKGRYSFLQKSEIVLREKKARFSFRFLLNADLEAEIF